MKKNYILNMIMSFVLSIFLTLIVYLTGTCLGLFTESAFINAMDNSGYYQSVIDVTRRQTEDLSIPMGIDIKVLDQVFNLEETKADCKKGIKSQLNNEELHIDTKREEQQLRDNIYSFIKELGTELDASQEQNIDLYVNTVTSLYRNNLKIPFINYYIGIKHMFNRIMAILLPILIILSSITIVLIFKLNKNKFKSYGFIATSTISTALMCFIIPVFLMIEGFYNRINIKPEYFMKFLAQYLKGDIAIYIYFAGIMCLISVILIFFGCRKRRKLLNSPEEGNQ